MDIYSKPPRGSEPEPRRSGRLLRIGEVTRTTSLSRATIYRLVGSRSFPAPIALSAGRVAWPSEDIEAWLDSRPRAG
jgi:prophage regulatory protein